MSVTRYDSTRGFTRKLWESCPWEALDDPGLGFKFYDDFNPVNAPAASTTAGGGWLLTVVGSGSAAFAGSNVHGGVGVLTCGATTTDKGGTLTPGGATSAFITPAANRRMFFETRLAFTPVSTAPASFIGFSTQITGLGTAGTVDGTNYIGFYSTSANACKFTYLNAGATLYLGDSLATYANDTSIQLGFLMNGLTGVDVYVNGVKSVVTATSTKSLPDDIMNISLSLISKGTITPTLKVDWVRFACVGGT